MDLLIQPEFLEGSVATLRSLGWERQGNQLPRGPEFLFGPPVILEDRRRGRIRLYARALANTDLTLRPVKPPPSHVAETEGGVLSVVPHEYALVAALDAHLEDGLDWRADALMILRSGPLDWEIVAQLVAGRSTARQRLNQLRMEWKLDVPAVHQAGRIRTRSEATLMTALRIWRHSKNHFLRPSGKPFS